MVDNHANSSILSRNLYLCYLDKQTPTVIRQRCCECKAWLLQLANCKKGRLHCRYCNCRACQACVKGKTAGVKCYTSGTAREAKCHGHIFSNPGTQVTTPDPCKMPIHFDPVCCCLQLTGSGATSNSPSGTLRQKVSDKPASTKQTFCVHSTFDCMLSAADKQGKVSQSSRGVQGK